MAAGIAYGQVANVSKVQCINHIQHKINHLAKDTRIMIRRNDITGFTLHTLKYWTEFVFCKHKLTTIAIYTDRNIKLVKRFTL